VVYSSIGFIDPPRSTYTLRFYFLVIDPLYVANEGKLLAVVAPESADAALEALRNTEGGGDAQIIGEVREEPPRMVIMHTQFGGTRMIDMLVGDPLPRIC
jgi:hydrogenase expression/formation protein HypE